MLFWLKIRVLLCRKSRCTQQTGINMNRKERENQCDIVLGEAVLELLGEKATLTDAALLQKLQDFLVDAGDRWRETAIRDAIRMVSGENTRH